VSTSPSGCTAVLATALVLLLGAPAGAQAPPPASRAGGVGGIKWSVPKRWSEGAGSSMRVATYKVPAARGAEAGEMAVFFFGTGQGGTVDGNVTRWSKQFEGDPLAKRTSKRVGNLPVTLVRIEGTYLAPGGPMMQSQAKKPGYRLLGAIVEGPDGFVFFKLTGPASTLTAAQADFDALVASFAKG
jgi:hypothetical protein